MIRQQREQQLGNVFCGSRMSFNSDDSTMFRQRQDNPITKMTIQRNQRSLLLHGPFKHQRVISPCLAGFGRADNIMTCLAQQQNQFDPKHLIEVKAQDG